MPHDSFPVAPPRWELAAESIAVKIRWFGLLVGCAIAALDSTAPARQAILNAILLLGAAYTVLDTWCSVRGRVFLGRSPLAVVGMESLFIGLLCYFHTGLDSPFRYFYFLSLIVCAIRWSSQITCLAWIFHGVSYTALFLALPHEPGRLGSLILTLVVLGWVAWASDALAMLLKHVGLYLGRLNRSLQENQSLLEARIDERTRQLREAQAHLLHQEKMAAFGLLAAGIAHEVGNPLTAISAVVQVLQRRATDPAVSDKLALVRGELQRIQVILRELVDFSRPASSQPSRFTARALADDALNIAKYYSSTKARRIDNAIPDDLPPLHGLRDQMVQVLLNLVLNAVDATGKDGRITLSARPHDGTLEITVADNGPGIAPEHSARLFEPYFTTKRNGTGLGLFVSRKLVADHGGTLELSSTPGPGASFRIRLPLPAPEPARDVPRPAVAPLLPGTS